MRLHHALIATAIVCAGAATGCAPGAKYKSTAVPTKTGPIDKSLFARGPNGFIDEEQIQAILERPLEIELPARIGVLPIVEATDWHGPSPDMNIAPPAIEKFSGALRGAKRFTMVTEMIPIPSGALGMEALREMAARYKLRYVVLYREHIDRRRRTNPWAIGYITGIGALFLPGDTLSVEGYVEASMFDVKTGLLMFTVRRRVRSATTQNVWHTDDKLERLQRGVAERVSSELAADLRRAIKEYESAVAAENQIREEKRAAAEAQAKPTAELPAAGATAPTP